MAQFRREIAALQAERAALRAEVSTSHQGSERTCVLFCQTKVNYESKPLLTLNFSMLC